MMGISSRDLERCGVPKQRLLAAIQASGKSSARNAPQGPPDFDPPKGNKYHAVKTEVDGIKFDSKAEAAHYSQLCLLMKAGEVAWFCRQPRFVLPGGVEYVADFIVVYRTGITGGMIGRIEIQDVKGVRTDIYKLKQKQVKAIYGIDIVEITT